MRNEGTYHHRKFCYVFFHGVQRPEMTSLDRAREQAVNFHGEDRLVGLVVKTSASRAEDTRFDSRFLCGDFFPVESYLLTYAHRSQWSIGYQRPPAIALCSGLFLSFRTSWSPAVSALLQCLASNCCEAGLSSSSPVGSRSGLDLWC